MFYDEEYRQTKMLNKIRIRGIKNKDSFVKTKQTHSSNIDLMAQGKMTFDTSLKTNNIPFTWHAPRHTSQDQPIKITL